MFNLLGQVKLIESLNALQEAKLKTPVYFKMSWRERLLSRPWKPWKKWDFYLRKNMMEPAAYFMRETTQLGFQQPAVLVYHPALKEQILRMIEEANSL